MIMSATDEARFPKCARYVKKELPKVVEIPIIAKAMQTTGQLNRTSFRAALKWGNQPTILIVPGLAACGQFTPTPGNNTIEIRESIFTDFEAGKGRLVASAGNVYALGLNLLHELVHWGDNLDGVDRPGEEGDEFEMLVYGANLGC
jgi:hypothetical protein